MVAEKRFVSGTTQRQPEVQPGSPVYVHCTRQSIEPKTGAVLLQVRMVNCAEQKVQTVIFSAEGLNEVGTVVFTMHDLILPNCNAAPHSVFGEGKIFALERKPIHRVRITVERVAFADGICWSRSPESGLVSEREAGYIACSCSMRNPKGIKTCLLCGKPLVEELPKSNSQEDFPEIMVPYIDYTPQPIAPSCEPRDLPSEEAVPQPVDPAPLPSEEETELPSSLIMLLCILGVVAVLVALSFLAYSLMQYFG